MRTPLPLRPPRWSIHLLCGLAGGSLLIFLLAMGIWVRSYFVGDVVYAWRHWMNSTGQALQVRDYTFVSARGRVFLERLSSDAGRPQPSASGWRHYRGTPMQDIPLEAKYTVHPDGSGSTSRQRIVLPLWLFGLFAIPPVLWVRRWRRGKRGRGFLVEVKAEVADQRSELREEAC